MVTTPCTGNAYQRWARVPTHPNDRITHTEHIASRCRSMQLQAHARATCRAVPHGAGMQSRRDLLLGTLAFTACQDVFSCGEAHAALVQFPTDHLKNTYYLVRAGMSAGEDQNVTVTNPVWKTNGVCGLSKSGVRQVYTQTMPALKQLGACEDGCWIWPSITQNAYQTAEIISSEFSLGYSRIVPEYSFLDKRGLGALEDLPYDSVLAQVAQADSLDASWRPIKGTDGTPHESMQDVLVRMRQLMSITETQYTGQDVLVISPDSYNLSALQAAVLGVGLAQHDLYKFAPGEVRRLQVGSVAYDASPRRFSCPDPPKCLRMGAATNEPGQLQLLP